MLNTIKFLENNEKENNLKLWLQNKCMIKALEVAGFEKVLDKNIWYKEVLPGQFIYVNEIGEVFYSSNEQLEEDKTTFKEVLVDLYTYAVRFQLDFQITAKPVLEDKSTTSENDVLETLDDNLVKKPNEDESEDKEEFLDFDDEDEDEI